MTLLLLGLYIQHLVFSYASGLQNLQRVSAISDCMGEHSTKLKRAKKKTRSLESELKKAKLALAEVDQLKADLAAME